MAIFHKPVIYGSDKLHSYGTTASHAIEIVLLRDIADFLIWFDIVFCFDT